MFCGAKSQVSSFFAKFKTISDCVPVHNLSPDAASVSAYLAVPQLQDLIFTNNSTLIVTH